MQNIQSTGACTLTQPCKLGNVKPAEERFWKYVDVREPDECWLWNGNIVRRGYGLFRVNANTRMHAHRWSYQHAHGQLPAHVRVDHRFHCDVRCVNPAHLRPATAKQNNENRAGAQANSSSGVRGVYWSTKDRSWRTQVRHHGHKHSAGSFHTIEEAEKAVIALRRELFTHSEMDRSS